MVTTATPLQIGKGRLLALRITTGVLGVALAALTVIFGIPALFEPDYIHAVHDASGLSYALLFAAPLLAITLRPANAPASLQQMVALGVLPLVISVIGGSFDPFGLIFLLVALVVAALAGFGHLSPKVKGASRPLTWAALIGAVPLVVYAWGQLQLQLNAGPGDVHSQFGHYRGMAIIAFGSVLAALVAATKVPGRRVAAWLAGLSVAVLGLVSVMTRQVSAWRGVWPWIGMAGGIAFIVLARREKEKAPS